LKRQILQSTKKSLAQSKIPRILTRGYYDLSSGATLKKKKYDLYPKRFFEDIGKHKEIAIMVHGMRNDRSGALGKFKIAQTRLRQLGFGHPVIGFSYDANVYNAHLRLYEKKAICVAKIIAKKNGSNLARFILDVKRKHPFLKIRLIGHSLGTEVILHAISEINKKDYVESVHFFGSSIDADVLKSKSLQGALKRVISKKLYNYYSPKDDVLKHSYDVGIIGKPLGYVGYRGPSIPKLVQKRVFPRNHRFASYACVLTGF
jgi:pimeloyl-ACP methyl ester carboxylesterase